MANSYQALSGDVSSLFSAMKETDNKDEFRRFQAVYLRLSNGLKVKDISLISGYCEGWVRQLHSLYKSGGIEALRVGQKGGRNHANMTLEEEDKFITPFLAEASKGGILEVGKIHRAYEKKMERNINKSVVYKLLYRHGWRKISPRPIHPDYSPEAGESFKKTGK